ncbi:hypothetical protein FD754_006001, partial [Muntiacus muntjak]
RPHGLSSLCLTGFISRVTLPPETPQGLLSWHQMTLAGEKSQGQECEEHPSAPSVKKVLPACKVSSGLLAQITVAVPPPPSSLPSSIQASIVDLSTSRPDLLLEMKGYLGLNKQYQVSWELLCGSWFWLEKKQTLRLFQPRLSSRVDQSLKPMDTLEQNPSWPSCPLSESSDSLLPVPLSFKMIIAVNYYHHVPGLLHTIYTISEKLAGTGGLHSEPLWLIHRVFCFSQPGSNRCNGSRGWGQGEGTHQLVESGRYDTREDFTVVVQPFFEKVDMPKTPAHAHAASALWNNMLQPVGQKTRQHNFEDKINITCPDQARPFLSTYKNLVQVCPCCFLPAQLPDQGSQLLCSDRAPSASPPTSVHTLRPADIQVVAALGDSLTAGNGIGSKPDDLSDVTTQYRGLSYREDTGVASVGTSPSCKRKTNQKEEQESGGYYSRINTSSSFMQSWKRIRSFKSSVQALALLYAGQVTWPKLPNTLSLRSLHPAQRNLLAILFSGCLCDCREEACKNFPRSNFRVYTSPLKELNKLTSGLSKDTCVCVNVHTIHTRAHPGGEKRVKHPFPRSWTRTWTPAPSIVWGCSPFADTSQNSTQGPRNPRMPSIHPPLAGHKPMGVLQVPSLGALWRPLTFGPKPNTVMIWGFLVLWGSSLEQSTRVERGEEGTEAPLSLGEAGERGGLSPATGEEQDMYGFFRRGVKKPEVARLSISVETHGAKAVARQPQSPFQKIHLLPNPEDFLCLSILLWWSQFCRRENSLPFDHDHTSPDLAILPQQLLHLLDTLFFDASLPNTCHPLLRTPRNSNYTYPTTPAIESSLTSVENGWGSSRNLQAIWVPWHRVQPMHPKQFFPWDRRTPKHCLVHGEVANTLFLFSDSPLTPSTTHSSLPHMILYSDILPLPVFIKAPCSGNNCNWGSDFLCTEQNPSNSVPTSGDHETSPGNLEALPSTLPQPCSNTTSSHETSLQPQIKAIPSLLPPCSQAFHLYTAVGARPSNSSDLPTSWRGLSWSIGGDGDLGTHTTLPNILKKFNPNILGFSTGTREETAGLNVATEGARARDMPAQARDLVERMKTRPEINLQKDWKLITLFIGSNDLCHYCDNQEARSAEEYVKYIRQALDILYEQLPRTFINVVEVMELADLHQGQDGKCGIPLAAQSNCTCLQGSQENLPEMQELKTVNWDFQSALSTLSYQYLQREDFAVVVQPFFQNTLVPLNKRGGADLTFFSEDCFHFSEHGHAEMAIALWNNMLEPVGHKTTSNNFTYSRTKLKCPSAENPYLRTLKNSQLLQDQADAEPPVLSWAVPVAAGGGLVVGVGAVMTWRALRGRQKENSPLSLNTMSF